MPIGIIIGYYCRLIQRRFAARLSAAAPFINGTRGAIYRRERANSRERAGRDLRRIYALRNNSSAFTD